MKPWRAILAQAALAAVAHGGEILAKDDLLFARELARQGYPDLAQDLIDAVVKSRGGDAAKDLEIRALRMDLDEELALREPDPQKKLQTLLAILETKETFTEANSGSESADEMQVRMPDLYRIIGELIAAELANDGESKATEELRLRGQEMFDRAVRLLETRLQKLAERRAELELEHPDPELEQAFMVASYSLARTHYFRALALEKGSEKREESQRAALAILFDFQLDFADQLLCYEGMIYEGLCHKDLGDTQAALDSLDGAIRLRTSYERLQNGVYQMAPAAADVVSAALYQKMLIFAEQGKEAEVVALAREFATTTPDAASTLSGPLILVREAQAYRALGDSQALEAAAKRMIELDPRGWLGERGQEFLRQGGSAAKVATSDTMRLAENAAARGEWDRAVELCQEVTTRASAEAKGADLGSQAALLLGGVFAERGWMHEAAIAWDTAADRFASGKNAPDCLWRAINAYQQLESLERRAYYRNRARERMTELTRRYPAHAYASMAAIVEGQQREQDEEFAVAAELYERVAQGAAGREEALYRAGNAWSREARALLLAGKRSESTAAAAKAEARLTEAIPALEVAAAATLERTLQDRFLGFAFNARVSLANLFLLEGIDRASEVAALFSDTEKRYPGDKTKSTTARRLRMRALQVQGRLDEAMSMMDAQMREDPKARGISAAAASLAQAVDNQAKELAGHDPQSRDAQRLWERAFAYYFTAISAESEGSDVARAKELETIADRLYSLALQLSRVPEGVVSFLDLGNLRVDPEFFDRAIRAYEIVLPLTASHRTRINLARAQAFLGHWPQAATRYAELFERDKVVDLNAKTIDADLVRARPELLFASLEWGVCEREVAVATKDNSRLTRAGALFEALVTGTTNDGKPWWFAKYYQLRTLVDRGEYDVAEVALRSIERNYPDFDEGRFGLADRFKKLAVELEKLVQR